MAAKSFEPGQSISQNTSQNISQNISKSQLEIILHEVDGKNIAAERYDSMIWKIRTGYVVVLYGAITLLVGQSQSWTDRILEILILSVGFSLLGFAVDWNFRLRQLRVVVDREKLIKSAFDIAGGQAVDSEKIKPLLRMSGESGIPISGPLRNRSFSLLLMFYAATPVMVLVFYLRS
mgnify:CR=1 FL=1